MANAVDVAREFLRLAKDAGQPLTNMQIQKLVYIAHGVHLAREDEALLDEEVNAWKHGPVIPAVYLAFKQYLNKEIDLSKEARENVPLSLKEKDSVKFTFDNFAKYNGWTLRDITHKEGSPWHKIWFDGNGYETYNAEIPNRTIKEHYKNIFRTNKVTAL
ncbi:Panacea domain-containing protein [Pseudoalteromonas sp. T1lg122]|uniref:Panacea domain-containing protein n=1 Tax=Pseudoalteromonas sp. T1lg122 TaxID=2077094 RepID=UPI000CF6B994|nr:type II toxin-antitoxin system antitoxin SocA domain-containing protein [Pseudoalteromonas sp. T1lg122]